MTSRRSFLIGIGAALAAPAVVRAESLMKIAVLRESAANKTATEAFNEASLRRILEDDVYADRLARAILVAERQVAQAFLTGSGWVRHDARGPRNIDPWQVNSNPWIFSK